MKAKFIDLNSYLDNYNYYDNFYQFLLIQHFYVSLNASLFNASNLWDIFFVKFFLIDFKQTSNNLACCSLLTMANEAFVWLSFPSNDSVNNSHNE